MASTQPAPQTDRSGRSGRFALAVMTLVALSMFAWLVATLAFAAFG